MIRKWLKCNTSFIELLKNSTVPKNLEQKWQNNSCKYYGDCCSLTSTNSNHNLLSSFTPSWSTTNKPVKSFSTFLNPQEGGDGETFSDFDESEKAVTETPIKTQLFEIKGPKGSAFLIEVYAKDLEEVRTELIRLKGDFFLFDSTIIEWFAIKCILTAEPLKAIKDQTRLAKIHAISSGSEEVYELNNTGKFLFVSAVDRTMRAKRILEKLGYKISEILYRFQPKEKIKLEDHLFKVCNDFVKTVEKIPKVISVIHNL